MFAPLSAKTPAYRAPAATDNQAPAPRSLQRSTCNQEMLALLSQQGSSPALQARASFGAAPRLAIQPKLAVGKVDNPLEDEADRVADRVMRMPASSLPIAAAPSQLQRKCDACADEDENTLHAKPAGPSAASGEAPAIVHQVLGAAGQPFDHASRAFFEPRFGADFGNVRIHADAQAARSAASVNARAYTFGNHIVLGAGGAEPLLLAHELAHVVQQRGSEQQVRRSGDFDIGGLDSQTASNPSTMKQASHTDGPAEGIAKSINAKAFTVRHNVAFGGQQFSPGLDEGRSLIAHELTHVLQQAGADAARARKNTGIAGPTAVGRIPGGLDVPTMSQGTIQRSTGDEASSIKQKLMDAIDEAFRARDAWKTSDNIGQEIYSERLGLLLGRKSADQFASMQELNAYIAESDKAALTELDTMAKLGLDAVERFPHVFPLTWAARVRDTLSLEVDLKSIKERLEGNSQYAESLAKRIPTSLFWWGLPRTFAEAVNGETPFKVELRHAEWPKPHATRDFALGWIEYARTQAEVSFVEFWQSIVQSLSDDISTGKIKVDHAFQASYKDFMQNQRGVVLAIPGKIRAFGASQPEFSGDDILKDVERVALVVNNIASLASMFTFIPIWLRAEAVHAEKVAENDESIASLDPNGRVTQAMLWAYNGGYFSEAGKRFWQAVKAGAKENAAEMVGAVILQLIPGVDVAVDVYFLYLGVKDIDAALKGFQTAFLSASNATTTVDLQRESAGLALAITGQGASLALSILAAVGAVSSLRAKAAKIRRENPKISNEEAMNKALTDTQSKEGAALRDARKKQPGFTPEEIQLSQQKAIELAKKPENVHAIDDPIYDIEIDLGDRKKYRRMKGKDVWCLFKNPTNCGPEFSSAVNQAAENAKKIKPIPSAVLEQYRKLPEVELFRRAGEEVDESAWAVIRERYPSNEAALKKILGSDYRVPHTATAIHRRGGKTVARMELQSGGVANLPAAERELGWMQRNLASHTERWGLRNANLQPGDVLEFIGQYDPCSSCVRAMRAAADRTGATIKYWWPGGNPGLTFEPRAH